MTISTTSSTGTKRLLYSGCTTSHTLGEAEKGSIAVFDLVSDKPGTPDVAQKQKPVHKMLLHQSNMLPSSFINMFHSRNQIDSYAFRSADLYISHFSRNRYFTILFRDPKMWNALPN